MNRIDTILNHDCDKGREKCGTCMAKYIIMNPCMAPAHPVPKILRDHGKQGKVSDE